MARKSRFKAKDAKPVTAKPAPQADVLEEVDTDGPGIDEGIIFTTFALLAGAVYMIYSLLDGRYPDPLA